MCGRAGISGLSPKSDAAAHQVTIGRARLTVPGYRLSDPPDSRAKRYPR